MPTVFSRIIAGELPARFVWRDDRAVAFLSAAPLKPGHTLVVPVAEIDHWLDADPDLLVHLTTVSREVGRAIDQVWQPERVGLAIVGLEVPHLHIHVVPMWTAFDLDFAKADANPSPESLDDAADRLRRALADLGHDAPA